MTFLAWSLVATLWFWLALGLGSFIGSAICNLVYDFLKLKHFKDGHWIDTHDD